MRPITPRVVQHGNYYSADLAESNVINTRLLNALRKQVESGKLCGSHFFNGRYENLYLNEAAIPEIVPVLHFAKHCAASVLRVQASRLACGFWFNRMLSGEVTGRHSHDDNDELLSAVYYVNVPDHCGDLVLFSGDAQITVTPVAGRLLMFSPTLEHEVIAAHFAGERVAVGMNFGIGSGTKKKQSHNIPPQRRPQI